MPAAAAIGFCPTSVSTHPRLPQAHRRTSGRRTRRRTRRRTLRAAGPPAAQHDASADADLPDHADEAVDPDRGAGPVLGEAREVDSFSTSAEARGASGARRRRGCRASRGSARRPPCPTPPRPGRARPPDPDRPQALAGGDVSAARAALPSRSSTGFRSRAAVVAIDRARIARAGQVINDTATSSTLISGPIRPSRPTARARRRTPTPRDTCASLFPRTKSSATSSETRLETVPRLRPVPPRPRPASTTRWRRCAQDDAEVRPADGRWSARLGASPRMEGQRRYFQDEAISIVQSGMRALLLFIRLSIEEQPT